MPAVSTLVERLGTPPRLLIMHRTASLVVQLAWGAELLVVCCATLTDVQVQMQVRLKGKINTMSKQLRRMCSKFYNIALHQNPVSFWLLHCPFSMGVCSDSAEFA